MKAIYTLAGKIYSEIMQICNDEKASLDEKKMAIKDIVCYAVKAAHLLETEQRLEIRKQEK